MATSPIIIVGGGIGGLTLALELAKRNISCQVFEQASEFSEVGAGLQLSPNAMRRLEALGLGTALSVAGCAPPKIMIGDALNRNSLNEIHLGVTAQERYKAPYLVLARRDLQSILLDALKAYDCVELLCSKKFITYSQNAHQITAEMTDGSHYQGRMLVGADGVWSRVRHMFEPTQKPKQTGFMAWRAMVKTTDAPSLFTSSNVHAWLGPDSHLVHYRVSGGDNINIVAVTKGKALEKTWSDDTPKEALFEEIRPFNDELRQAVMDVPDWTAWPLMVLKPFKNWSKGRAVLLGDAAHAIVPFLAQGAAMAIEDASSLAALIAEKRDDHLTVFEHYKALRFRRCRRVLSKSIYQAQIYHSAGRLAKIRNSGLKILPSSLLLRQYDWLYKY
ncbi:MAG: FAD-dependent monooxygenase [Rhizobiales bacterium]|nr:FAD-dependent monooxygenase [Hyphomicrobiales bacterium]